MSGEGGSNVVAADFRPHVVIVTKRRTYDLGPDAVGQPLEEVFGAAIPAGFRGLKRYMTEDGWVIARPDPGEGPATMSNLPPRGRAEPVPAD